MSSSVAVILAALQSNDSISADVVRHWMGERDLRTRGAIYYLIHQASDRIVPQFPAAEQCSFMLDYLFDCLLQNPESEDYLHSGFEAAWELAAWVKHLQNNKDGHSMIPQIVRRLTDAYLAADETTRNRIETGTVEHVLESPPLRKYFASWEDDPRLAKAYELCLQWGQAHERDG